MSGEILCENRRGYPTETGGEIAVTVVLVQGGLYYAAYAGVGSHEFIAANGNKLSFEEAIIHFPVGLKRQRYRD